jgi:hypothetical protein
MQLEGLCQDLKNEFPHYFDFYDGHYGQIAALESANQLRH